MVVINLQLYGEWVDKLIAGNCLRKLGHRVTKEEVEHLISSSDIDADGKMNLDEFINMVITIKLHLVISIVTWCPTSIPHGYRKSLQMISTSMKDRLKSLNILDPLPLDLVSTIKVAFIFPFLNLNEPSTIVILLPDSCGLYIYN
jgi:hypothetical protein